MKVAMMKLELPKQLDWDGLQKQVTSGWKSVAGAGHTVFLAYLGLWAIVYDSTLGVYQGSAKLLGSAEQRGERMENDVTRRFHLVEEKTADDLKRLQDQVESNVGQVRGEVLDIEEEMEKRIQQVLANLGIPSRERVERLSQEIDSLTERIDRELLQA